MQYVFHAFNRHKIYILYIYINQNCIVYSIIDYNTWNVDRNEKHKCYCNLLDLPGYKEAIFVIFKDTLIINNLENCSK